jgi:3-isopropylmalate/(R)-2-methylmalate dehydratase small subunit
MVILPVADIDTDQIIPARFLKVTDKVGLGEKLFFDWRYQTDGSPKPDFAINLPENQGRQVLLAGHNFGCGSSREHAPWALVDWGLRAIISTSFADIFRGNALKNGLLPVVVDAGTHAALLAAPDTEVSLDLATQSLSFADTRVEFPVDGFSKKCLLEGIDQLGYLQGFEDQIKAYEERS